MVQGCLPSTQKALNKHLQNRADLHRIPSLYSGPEAGTEDLATASRTGDGETKSRKPGPRQRELWVRPPTCTPKSSQWDIGEYRHADGQPPLWSGLWEKLESYRLNVLSSAAGEEGDNWKMLAYTLKGWEGAEQCISSVPFLYHRMDKELS